MPLIDYVTADDATGRAKEILEDGNYRKRSLMLEIIANHPPLLEAVREEGRLVMFEGELPRDLKELIGVVVSQVNECNYCTASHRENLFKLRVPGDHVLAIADGDYGELPERQAGVARFVEAVSTDPNSITNADIESLESIGFEIPEIVEMVGVVGHFNAVNTYASVFQVEPGDRDEILPRYLALNRDDITALETLWRTV